MSLTVLAVDDEPAVLMVIEIKLRTLGWEVVTAGDGEEALELAHRLRPDVVLLDVMMPKLDGLSVARRLKMDLQPVPLVILLSARGQEGDVREGLMAGADDYIIKPFSPRELVQRLKKVLARTGRMED